MKLKTRIKNFYRMLFPTLEQKFNKWLKSQNIKSYSQYNQDLFVKYYYRNLDRDIFFVDIGANDGISLSNTYIFDNHTNNGGGGVLIEADSNVYEQLLKNRPNPNISKYNVALCNIDGEVEFMQITGYSQMLSGIVEEYDKRHLERVYKEIQEYGGSYEIIKIKGARFDTIMNDKSKNIDYLSIDIEGGEMKILQSIDFNKYNIQLIGIENNYQTNDISNFLKQKGYKHN